MSKRFDPSLSHPRPDGPAARPAGSGFMPMAEALAEFAAPPAADAPLVAPHEPGTAEFQPPRPLRRAPVRFAHIRADGES